MIQKDMVLFLHLMCCCLVMGQQHLKKNLSEQGYEQWGTLSIKNISTQGNWTSYEMNYVTGADTLFLQHVVTKKSYAYPKGTNGNFGGENLFGYLRGTDLTVVALKNYRLSTITEVKGFEFVNEGAYIVTYHTDNSLQVRTMQGELVDFVAGVSSFEFNFEKDALIYNQKIGSHYFVGCFDFKSYLHTPITDGVTVFDTFTWQEEGKCVVFSNGGGIVFYNVKSQELAVFDVRSLSDYTDALIVKNGLTGFRISNDGQRVFFSVAKPINRLEKDPDGVVEIWNGTDAVLFPTKKQLNSRDTPKLVVWYPMRGDSNILSSNALYRVRLTENSNYVILSNPFSYGLEPSYYEKVDYYLKNVQTDETTLLLEKQSHDPNMLCTSPYDDRLVYYRNKDWWLYNPLDDSSLNLTVAIATTWDNDGSDAPKQFGVYGIAGWSADEKSVLIYDAFDIWEFALDGTMHKRLTSGKEQDKIYRIAKTGLAKTSSRAYDSGISKSLNLDTGLLLEVRDLNYNSGYASFSKTKGVKLILFENKYFSSIKKSVNGTMVFSSQTFSQSPEVVILKEGKKPQTLFKSNKQQVHYNYGYSKLISYTNSKGSKLNGVLFFPSDYNEEMHYPMIVYVYEKMTYQLNHYINPTLLNATGFSVTPYTLNGYFVLMPDISYELSNPGISAADCIISSVKKTISSYPIDSKKIGLIGHSFGGYETNFTLAQTGIFAAAVSGAGISDPIGRYFEIGTNGSFTSEMWRFESQQFRMGASFYENKSAYFQNSPLVNANKITTPLLLWAGKEDPVVPFRQSTSFYMALRRLGIRTLLLAYEKEEHNFKSAVAQTDLSIRIRQWFDYYLKDYKKVAWIEKGFY